MFYRTENLKFLNKLNSNSNSNSNSSINKKIDLFKSKQYLNPIIKNSKIFNKDKDKYKDKNSLNLNLNNSTNTFPHSQKFRSYSSPNTYYSNRLNLNLNKGKTQNNNNINKNYNLISTFVHPSNYKNSVPNNLPPVYKYTYNNYNYQNKNKNKNYKYTYKHKHKYNSSYPSKMRIVLPYLNYKSKFNLNKNKPYNSRRRRPLNDDRLNRIKSIKLHKIKVLKFQQIGLSNEENIHFKKKFKKVKKFKKHTHIVKPAQINYTYKTKYLKYYSHFRNSTPKSHLRYTEENLLKLGDVKSSKLLNYKIPPTPFNRFSFQRLINKANNISQPLYTTLRSSLKHLKKYRKFNPLYGKQTYSDFYSSVKPPYSLGKVIVSLRSNNAFMSILTYRKNKLLYKTSAGAIGFPGPKRSTNYAKEKLAFLIGKKANSINYKIVDVICKFSPGRVYKHLLKGFSESGLSIRLLKAFKALPHGKIRASKRRRV